MVENYSGEEMKKLNELQIFIYNHFCKYPHRHIDSLVWTLYLEYNKTFKVPELSKEVQFLKRHRYIKRSKMPGRRYIGVEQN